jgi:hypothetical protein
MLALRRFYLRDRIRRQIKNVELSSHKKSWNSRSLVLGQALLKILLELSNTACLLGIFLHNMQFIQQSHTLMGNLADPNFLT